VTPRCLTLTPLDLCLELTYAQPVVAVAVPRLRGRQASVGGVIVGIVSTMAVITIAAGPAIADPGAGLPRAGPAAGAAFRRATEIRLPANAAAVGDSQLTAVACTGAGSCIAGGSYRARGGHYEPMVVAESGGTWARAVELRLPPHAAASRNGDLEAAACTGAGSCEAIGSYTDLSGKGQAMAIAEVQGRWRRAREIGAPADAGPNPAAFLHGLSCTRAGSCAASGFYTNSSATVQAMRVTESNGRWGQATRIALPLNASADPEAFTDSIACTATGNCLGVGGYGTAAALQAMSVTEAGGRWRRGTQVAAETGALNTALHAVACVTAARCVAVGNFANPADHFLALSVTRSNGRWGTATVVRTPPSASLGGNQFGDLDAIACTRSGRCTAVGSYTSRTGARLPMAATRF
jgi:hypothetical protein